MNDVPACGNPIMAFEKLVQNLNKTEQNITISTRMARDILSVLKDDYDKKRATALANELIKLKARAEALEEELEAREKDLEILMDVYKKNREVV